jgi:hypothetical protein
MIKINLTETKENETTAKPEEKEGNGSERNVTWRSAGLLVAVAPGMLHNNSAVESPAGTHS